MAVNGLSAQSDLEALSAWMDGELPAEQSQRVARLVREDPRWRAAHRDFLAVDAALDRLQTPVPGDELTDRICRAARPRRLVARAARLLAPLAAAAAIVIAVWLGSTRPGPAGPNALESIYAEALADVPEQDRLMVEQMPMFQNYADVVSYEQVRSIVDGETLSELARLEGAGEI
jgi:anti-sigma factor RsiW